MSIDVPIPILDLRPEIEAHQDEYIEAFGRVLRSGQFILGPEVEAFEREVAAYLGVKHGIGVNSGTDALVISLRALGIGPGDEVITTPFTFFATAEAISNVGATPIFVDIDPLTFNMDPALVEPAITPRTRAIVPVHLFGQAANMEAIMQVAGHHELKVVEDVAQAMGGRYKGQSLGTFGDAGAFSFFPSKNLGGLGDGGLIATDSDEVDELVRSLRAHGASRKYDNEMIGYNSRLDGIQAAVLRVKLRRLDGANDERRRAARIYDSLLGDLANLQLPVPSADVDHAYHQYTVRFDASVRDHARDRLRSVGIDTKVYYPVPCHKLSPYRFLALSLPESEVAASEVLSLPIGPSIPESDQRRVGSAISALLGDVPHGVQVER